ncbi:MAG: hypothetical protein K0S47_4560 [Herbinix sp.]|jgi:hypothetical protein|nr:hypothetical protein [Herbinix sp.]
MINNADQSLLEQTYKNATMGVLAIESVLDKAKNQDFSNDLHRQMQGYQELASKSKEELDKLGVEAKEKSIYDKTMLKGSIKMNTMMDASDSHIADMVIKGSTMGITEMSKLLHEHPHADGTCTKIAREFVTEEEKNIDIMKSYL